MEFLAQEEWNEDYGTHIQLCESSDRVDTDLITVRFSP